MTELKIKALEKLNVELSIQHPKQYDAIHNFLSDQEDEALFEGILVEGKSLKHALQYVGGEIKKISSEQCAMADNEDVFQMVVDYYKSSKTIVPEVASIELTKEQVQKKKDDSAKIAELESEKINLKNQLDKIMGYKKTKEVTTEKDDSLSIFDFIDDGSAADEADT